MTFTWKHPKYYKELRRRRMEESTSRQASEATSEPSSTVNEPSSTVNEPSSINQQALYFFPIIERSGRRIVMIFY